MKAHRTQALSDLIGRSRKSVEYKHMNLSFVLDALGLPTITGYRPMANIQQAIFPAVERYLRARPDALTAVPSTAPGLSDTAGLWEEPPPPRSAPRAPRPEALERLVRHFDPVERDHRNRALGEAGEARVVDFERLRLAQADRSDLAAKVRWVSKEDGDGAGYDVRSFTSDGAERLIEVKTTVGGQTTPFFLTRNERALSTERPDAFRLYRLYDFTRTPRLFQLTPPLEQAVTLEPETWRAGFG